MPRTNKDVVSPTEKYYALLFSCAVPSCNTTNQNCPLKSFIPIPTEPNIRRIWLRRANIVVEDDGAKYAHGYFCEDHFDADTAIFPSRFECQYFMEFDMPSPAPPLQERHPLDKKKSKPFPIARKKKERIGVHGSSFKCDPLLPSRPKFRRSPPPPTESRFNQRILLKKPGDYLNMRLRRSNFLAWVVRAEHDYTKKKPIKKRYTQGKIQFSTTDGASRHTMKERKKGKILSNFMKQVENQRQTQISDNFLRNNALYVETQRNIELNESTQSGDSICTFKCNRCGLEFIHGNALQNHIKEKHIDNKQKQTRLKNNKQNDTETVSKSIVKFKCGLCGAQFVQNTDFQTHINTHFIVGTGLREEPGHSGDFDKQIEQDLDVFEAEPLQYCEEEDVPLDIKPEIFQCSKCPSSFINEEDMSKHLQIMHGDLTNLTRHIKKLRNNEQDAKSCIDISNSSNNEDCIEITQKDSGKESRCEVNSVNNFAEIETSVEIKRELEDIDFSMDNQNMNELDLGLLDPNIYTGTFFSETNSNANIEPKHSELNGEDLNSNETSNIKREYVDCQITANSRRMAIFQCSFQDVSSQQDSSQNLQCVQPIFESDLVQQNVNSEPILCRKCSMTFLSHEELLNHLHELINTKAKLYSDAKKVLKADSVRFKSPDSISRSGDKQYLNDAELLDYIHKVFNKSGKRNIILQVVKYADEEDKDTVKPVVDLKVCRCCSNPLPRSTIVCKRKDKICGSCKRIERIQEKRRKSARAKLYASAKNMQLKNKKNCADPKKDYDKALAKMLSHKSTNLSLLNEVLQSVSQIFDKPENEKAQIETDDDTFEQNDLLKPIREEDEKVLVPPCDPTLCKSCLIPLNAGKTKNTTVCEKCKKLEVSNEKRRKSNAKKISLENMKIPYVLLHRLPDVYNDKKCCAPNKSKNSNECNICHSKFSNRLYLRKHVVQCHL